MKSGNSDFSGRGNLLPHPQEFSLVLGGPLFQFLRRAHLADDALMMVRQRIIVITSIAWLPLLVLSALQGQMVGGGVVMPFLKDAEVHIRFLLAMPLLIVAELVVHRRTRPLLQLFYERNLIPANATPRFDAAVASALRLRNSGNLRRRGAGACANTGRWPSATCASSTPNGCTAVRRPRSRWWGAPTFSPSPI